MNFEYYRQVAGRCIGIGYLRIKCVQIIIGHVIGSLIRTTHGIIDINTKSIIGVGKIRKKPYFYFTCDKQMDKQTSLGADLFSILNIGRRSYTVLEYNIVITEKNNMNCSLNTDDKNNNNIPNIQLVCRHVVIIGHMNTGTIIHTTIYKNLWNSRLQCILRSENLYLIYLRMLINNTKVPTYLLPNIF